MTHAEILLYIVSLSSGLKYLLLFIGVFIEGPIIMIACGFLYRLGAFDIAPLYLTILSADLVADIGWYYAGYYFAEPLTRKYGKFIGITPLLLEKTKNIFSRYHEKILFISKITIGLGLALATLIVAGASKIPFRRYLFLNLIGEVILVFVMLSIGYAFGEVYNKYITEGFKTVFIVVSAVGVAGGIFGLTKYMKKRAMSL